jgi:hypothetical protein
VVVEEAVELVALEVAVQVVIDQTSHHRQLEDYQFQFKLIQYR